MIYSVHSNPPQIIKKELSSEKYNLVHKKSYALGVVYCNSFPSLNKTKTKALWIHQTWNGSYYERTVA